jgi:hypothetical protein
LVEHALRFRQFGVFGALAVHNFGIGPARRELPRRVVTADD